MCCPFPFFSSSSFAGVIISCSFQIEIVSDFPFSTREGSIFFLPVEVGEEEERKRPGKIPRFIFHFSLSFADKWIHGGEESCSGCLLLGVMRQAASFVSR